MKKMLDCPICGQPADYYITESENQIKVYFCSDCLEHFTEEDTITTIKTRVNSESSIIDEVYIAYQNTLKTIKNLTKNEPLDC
jgi:transposase-like protein